jgi:predicted nucleic acid-binding protein
LPSAPVADTSPLIHLGRADRLQLVRAVARTLLVPRAVVRELEAKGEGDPAVQALRTIPWLRVVDTADPPPEVRLWDLGGGEAAVLSWAHTHPGTVAILDDREARRCAHAVGIPVIGTLGIILQAKSAGLIVAARPEVERLVDHGMYLSRAVIDKALALVEE